MEETLLSQPLTQLLTRVILRGTAVVERALATTFRTNCQQLGLLQMLGQGESSRPAVWLKLSDRPSDSSNPGTLESIRRFHRLSWGVHLTGEVLEPNLSQGLSVLLSANLVHNLLQDSGVQFCFRLGLRGERMRVRARALVEKIENILFQDFAPEDLRAKLEPLPIWGDSLLFLLSDIVLDLMEQLEAELHRELSIGCRHVALMRFVESLGGSVPYVSESEKDAATAQISGPREAVGLFHDLFWGRYQTQSQLGPDCHHLILRLEVLGLVARLSDLQSDRHWRICLTPKGRGQLQRALLCIAEVEGRCFAALPEEFSDLACQMDDVLDRANHLMKLGRPAWSGR